MRYQHVLVSVALTPESHRLVERAVAIVRPTGGRITLFTVVGEPELYNHMAGPMLESLRELMHEETRMFMNSLVAQAGYPITRTLLASGELSAQLNAACKRDGVDLLICGNHNRDFFGNMLCSARSVVAASKVDVLLVALG